MVLKNCVVCRTEFNAKKNCKTCSKKCSDLLKRQKKQKDDKKYYGKNKRVCLRRNKDWLKKHPNYMKDYNRKRGIEILKLVGSNGKCIVCNSEECLVLHEIHGRDHPRKYIEKFQYIKNHPEDFVTLCRNCHMDIHYFARTMNMEKAIELMRMIKGERY